MRKLKKIALLLTVSFTAVLSAGCQDRSAHTQIAGDDRVSLIEIEGKCFALYHEGFGRSIVEIECHEGK